jgi:hypothetical protein
MGGYQRIQRRNESRYMEVFANAREINFNRYRVGFKDSLISYACKGVQSCEKGK